MTIRELLTILEDYGRLDENFLDFKLVMAGHDAFGERQYDIKVKDTGVNYDDGIVRLWDK